MFWKHPAHFQTIVKVNHISYTTPPRVAQVASMLNLDSVGSLKLYMRIWRD